MERFREVAHRRRSRWFGAAAVVACALCVIGAALVVRHRQPGPVAQDVVRLNFGRQRAGATVSVDCVIPNPTGRPIEIARVETTCGCATVGDGPKRIEPHGRASLPVRVQLPPDLHGPFGTKVVVFFAGRVPARTFVIEGSVHLACPPEVDFGTLKRGDPAARTFVVRSASPGKAVRVLGVRYDERRFGVRYDRSPHDPESNVTVDLLTSAAEGAVDADLAIQTDDEAEPVKHVRLKGHVLRPVETDLARLSFGSIGGSESREASFRVYSPYDKPFEITGVRVEPPDLLSAQPYRDGDGRSTTVRVTLRGPLPGELLDGKARVRVRCDEVARELTVDLYAERAAPQTGPIPAAQ